MRLKHILLSQALCLLFNVVTTASEDELAVLTENPKKQLQLLLMKEFYHHLDRRLEAFEALHSRKSCKDWQDQRREFFLMQIGGLPERTPLNAKVVGKLQGDGYHIEKILFESRPGHHVTANLYLPVSKGPWPAVLIPCGHSHNGKASDWYQRMSILLAHHGMAALCYDPVGQGERYQSLDSEQEHEFFPALSYKLPVPHPRVRFLCTTEHTLMGIGCILTGSNTAQFRIWDGMRAIDYLQSRDDIIATKIGCTGNSGGGTLTAYLMALDARITAAAPGCYLTTFRRLIESKGAQDAEQNIFGQIAFGMDEPDYLMMRAPKPTLILASTRDATFDIEGTWNLFRQSKRFYNRMRYPEHIEISEADVPHGMYPQHRESAARWMHRWLLGCDKEIKECDWETLPDPISDKELRELGPETWSQEDLYCTPEGQVMLMDGEVSVYEINTRIASELEKRRAKRWNNLGGKDRQQLICQSIGINQTETNNIDVRIIGQVSRNGYHINKVVLQGNKQHISLPGLLFLPEKVTKPPVLYLHGESMKVDALLGGKCEQFVQQGHIVLTAELSGIGETENNERDWARGRFGPDIQEIYLAYLLGKSFVGIRTSDILRWTNYLSHFDSDHAQQVKLIAIGEAAIPALHAAALEPSRFESVLLKRMISSWTEVVSSIESNNQLVNAVHGVLRHYDLPNLIEMVGKQKVTLQDPVDASGNQLH